MYVRYINLGCRKYGVEVCGDVCKVFVSFKLISEKGLGRKMQHFTARCEYPAFLSQVDQNKAVPALRVAARANAVFVIRIGRVPEKKRAEIPVTTGTAYVSSYEEQRTQIIINLH